MILIILIESWDAGRAELEADQHLEQAYSVLQATRIRLLGGGRFMDGSVYFVLAHEADGTRALAILEGAGIRASELKPRGVQRMAT